MARRDTHRAAWTLFVAVAVALGSGLDAGQAGGPSVQYRSPEGVEYRSLPDTDAVRSARAALEANPRDVARIIVGCMVPANPVFFRESRESAHCRR